MPKKKKLETLKTTRNKILETATTAATVRMRDATLRSAKRIFIAQSNNIPRTPFFVFEEIKTAQKIESILSLKTLSTLDSNLEN